MYVILEGESKIAMLLSANIFFMMVMISCNLPKLNIINRVNGVLVCSGNLFNFQSFLGSMLTKVNFWIVLWIISMFIGAECNAFLRTYTHLIHQSEVLWDTALAKHNLLPKLYQISHQSPCWFSMLPLVIHLPTNTL